MAFNVQNHAHDEQTSNSTPISRASARRTPSFSSSNSSDSSYGSSSISFNEEYPTFSPRTPLKLKGIPFSWEKIPGIPKHQLGFKKKEYSEHLLPLPPAGNSNSAAAKKLLQYEDISPNKSKRFDKDPFVAALVECSKDDDNNSKNISRGLSDIFGFISLYTSCKTTCAVSEPATVYLRPRPRPHYLLNRRSS